MLTWQRLAAVRDSHDGYALMFRTCNPSMRCRDWLMVGLPVGLPGLTACRAEGIGCMLGCLHAGLVGQLLGCRPCDALLFPSLPLFPSLLLRRPVALGPLSGFAQRLQSPVETGTPARRRSEGARFLNRLDAARRLHSQMPLFRQSRMPSWDHNRGDVYRRCSPQMLTGYAYRSCNSSGKV